MTRLLFLLPLVLISAWPGAAGAERMAESTVTDTLSPRQREAMRFHDCLRASSRSTDELLEQVTAFSFARPDQVYYSLTDFIAEGLKALCTGR